VSAGADLAGIGGGRERRGVAAEADLAGIGGGREQELRHEALGFSDLQWGQAHAPPPMRLRGARESPPVVHSRVLWPRGRWRGWIPHEFVMWQPIPHEFVINSSVACRNQSASVFVSACMCGRPLVACRMRATLGSGWRPASAGPGHARQRCRRTSCGGRAPIRLAAPHHRPGRAGCLVGQRHGGEFAWFALQPARIHSVISLLPGRNMIDHRRGARGPGQTKNASYPGVLPRLCRNLATARRFSQHQPIQAAADWRRHSGGSRQDCSRRGAADRFLPHNRSRRAAWERRGGIDGGNSGEQPKGLCSAGRGNGATPSLPHHTSRPVGTAGQTISTPAPRRQH
jgi:hypothetical protein